MGQLRHQFNQLRAMRVTRRGPISMDNRDLAVTRGRHEMVEQADDRSAASGLDS